MIDRESIEGTIRLGSVSAERSGEWGSLEKEIHSLVPLFFSEVSYLVVPPESPADYVAEIYLREREYHSGWRTQRSLSAEVRIWADQGEPMELLPLATGRALTEGRQSLASARTLSTMLRKAVYNAIRALPPKPLPEELP
ncbi:MAG: hypothetical protein FWH12_00035 [Treponema sp.]|nr:hypothetical protein [Treponema sp.]